VCIFPSGILNPYPPRRDDLWEEILLQDGCLLSTFPLHQPMRKAFFSKRNRWIVGLSPATFIVEANRRGGTRMTANQAIEEVRRICTLPVHADSTQGLANLDLIRNGDARMVCDARDLERFYFDPAADGKPEGPLIPGSPQSLGSEQKENSVNQP
jgi:DNA processing protein